MLTAAVVTTTPKSHANGVHRAESTPPGREQEQEHPGDPEQHQRAKDLPDQGRQLLARQGGVGRATPTAEYAAKRRSLRPRPLDRAPASRSSCGAGWPRPWTRDGARDADAGADDRESEIAAARAQPDDAAAPTTASSKQAWQARRRGASWLAPQPERDVGRLHGVVHDGPQLDAERLEVDLVTEPAAELLEGQRGVVALPVEAAVDDRLDPRAQRPEQRGNSERRGRDRKVGLPVIGSSTTRNASTETR